MFDDRLLKKVLLLNSSYEPLSIINSKKALIMLITQKVDYIEKSNYFVHSENLMFVIPRIVKLKSYIYI